MSTITSGKNPLIKSLKALGQHKGRQGQGRFLVEGEKMILEALSCGLTIRDVLCAPDSAEFAGSLKPQGAQVYEVPPELLRTVCDTMTPQGICASFDLPKPLNPADAPEMIVALDGVQDPGNVGTIWRTADAAGFGAILLGSGCADPLSPKVQRSAMGSGFRLPFMLTEDLPGLLSTLRHRGYGILASDLGGEDFYGRSDPGERFVLVIGSEARGISETIRKLADVRLKLPMRGGAESLNAAVAAGIMMYDLRRDAK